MGDVRDGSCGWGCNSIGVFCSFRPRWAQVAGAPVEVLAEDELAKLPDTNIVNQC